MDSFSLDRASLCAWHGCTHWWRREVSGGFGRIWELLVGNSFEEVSLGRSREVSGGSEVSLGRSREVFGRFGPREIYQNTSMSPEVPGGPLQRLLLAMQIVPGGQVWKLSN